MRSMNSGIYRHRFPFLIQGIKKSSDIPIKNRYKYVTEQNFEVSKKAIILLL